MSVKSVICEKDYVWNHATCICESGKYLPSIMDYSAIIWVEVIESQNDKTDFNEKMEPIKPKSVFYLHFYYLL